MRLPDDLWLQVISDLDAPAIRSVSTVSKRFHSLADVYLLKDVRVDGPASTHGPQKVVQLALAHPKLLTEARSLTLRNTTTPTRAVTSTGVSSASDVVDERVSAYLRIALKLEDLELDLPESRTCIELSLLNVASARLLTHLRRSTLRGHAQTARRDGPSMQAWMCLPLLQELTLSDIPFVRQPIGISCGTSTTSLKILDVSYCLVDYSYLTALLKTCQALTRLRLESICMDRKTPVERLAVSLAKTKDTFESLELRRAHLPLGPGDGAILLDQLQEYNALLSVAFD
ncbi:hypothetical protein LTS18_005900 [Coniosporium uncinatum]|uniref:Uncharacterized protein n=1 Tax=Coniosporium uncinatum TaxID=93489 RepID=A0ACC3DQR2_9PEZI|nr:hypothetical protein LTS18_005900 [Coniosporium uncinatum]